MTSNQYNQYHSPTILKELNCPSYVIEHSKAVMSKATYLARNFKGNVDVGLVKAGAMLHDVGRSQTNGIEHAVIGAKILVDNGFPPEIVKIVERHIGAGITRKEAEIIGLPPEIICRLPLRKKWWPMQITSYTEPVRLIWIL
ncbi:hypothetical protein GCM10025861_12330 [Methanobacterium petrolearium]|nr:hypothetical protein GCM10025861_12330 [Methanobacterium petrolearium]